MNKKHKHCELIKAWADGAIIQYKYKKNDNDWFDDDDPEWWRDDFEFRIKPEPKPELVKTMHIWFDMDFSEVMIADNTDVPNLKLTFDGETGELKSAEVLK